MDKPTINNTLKPCPFCGQHAHVAEWRKLWVFVTHYSVYCCGMACGATIDYCQSKESAIEDWNSRV